MNLRIVAVLARVVESPHTKSCNEIPGFGYHCSQAAFAGDQVIWYERQSSLAIEPVYFYVHSGYLFCDFCCGDPSIYSP